MRYVLAALALIIAVGCGDSGTEPEDRSVVGTYALVAVDGDPLPQDIFGSRLMSGTLDLRSNNSFTATTVYDDGTETESGTYTHTGSTIKFSTSEGQLDGTYDGTTIVVDAVVVELTYRR